MLRHFQIAEHRSSRHDGVLQMIDAETFEIFHLEVLVEFLLGCCVGESPVFHFIDKVFAAKDSVKACSHTAFHQNLLGHETHQQLIHVFGCAFGHEKFACGNIQEGHAHARLAEMDGRQEVVLATIQDIVAHGYAWCDEFGDAALHQFLGEFRVLQLVANGHAIASADEAWQVRIEGVVGETGHFGGRLRAFVVAACECDAQHACCGDGIVAVRFVEVATTEEKHRIGVLRFEVVELAHHWREFFFGHRRGNLGRDEFVRYRARHGVRPYFFG